MEEAWRGSWLGGQIVRGDGITANKDNDSVRSEELQNEIAAGFDAPPGNSDSNGDSEGDEAEEVSEAEDVEAVDDDFSELSE